MAYTGYFKKDGFKCDQNIPLPKTFHATLSAEDIGNKQIFAIGDIQGCYDELMELLDKADVTKNNSVVICCGDMVNKGPKSVETLRQVRQLGAHCVRGNHEEIVISTWLRWKEGHTPGDRWICQLSEEEMAYMMELPYTLSLPSVNALIVHAGLKPNIPIHQQQPLHMTTMRNLIPRDDRHPKSSEDTVEGVAWASLWTGPQHVYYGHAARRGLQHHPFATGLDTGCVKGRQLTGMFITGEKQLVQVPAHRTYIY